MNKFRRSRTFNLHNFVLVWLSTHRDVSSIHTLDLLQDISHLRLIRYFELFEFDRDDFKLHEKVKLKFTAERMKRTNF